MQGAGIRIDCYPRAPVSIRVDRPVHATRIFEGKAPEAVTELVPLVFAVCATAQGVAASQALAAATGVRPDASVTAAQGGLVRLETAREHLWRTLIDWPRFAACAVPPSALKQMQSLLPRAREALFATDGVTPVVSIDDAAIETVLADLDGLLQSDVLGTTPDEWLDIATAEDLASYYESSSAPVAALLALVAEAGWESALGTDSSYLPALPFSDLEAELAAESADRFVEQPNWDGRARETSPLSRQRDAALVDAVVAEFGSGLLARIVATVSELAMTRRDVAAILDGSIAPGITADSVSPGTGIAQVEAARGRLLHRAVIEQGRVASYRVVAPTEWNFHPRGVVSRALEALPDADPAAAQVQADLFVALMDPCVAYSVEVH